MTLKVVSPKNNAAAGDFKIKDPGLADFGRREIEMAEHEMPGLMATREKYGPQKPLAVAAAGVPVHGSFKPGHYRY